PRLSLRSWKYELQFAAYSRGDYGETKNTAVGREHTSAFDDGLLCATSPCTRGRLAISWPGARRRALRSRQYFGECGAVPLDPASRRKCPDRVRSRGRSL